MKREIKNLGICGILTSVLLSGCSNRAERVEAVDIDVPQISGMKAEFVPAGGKAVIYGSGLANAKVYFDTQFFNDSVQADVIESQDDMIIVTVPDKAWTGKIKDFIFRSSKILYFNLPLGNHLWITENSSRSSRSADSSAQQRSLRGDPP